VNEPYSAIEYCEFERIRDQHVSELAHMYWLLRGCPEGSPDVDWYKAAGEIDEEILAQFNLGLPA
jgi:hypothetical protein